MPGHLTYYLNYFVTKILSPLGNLFTQDSQLCILEYSVHFSGITIEKCPFSMVLLRDDEV